MLSSLVSRTIPGVSRRNSNRSQPSPARLGRGRRPCYERRGRTPRLRRPHGRDVPGRAYIVCCDARTGSGLLAEACGRRPRRQAVRIFQRGRNRQAVVAGGARACPIVSASPAFPTGATHLARRARDGRDLRRLRAFIPARRLRRNVPQARSATRLPPASALRAFFPRLRLVRLRRHNVVAQAISHHVAIATESGTAGRRRARPGESDRGALTISTRSTIR